MDLEVGLWCWINNLLHGSSLEHVFPICLLMTTLYYQFCQKKERNRQINTGIPHDVNIILPV